MLEVIVAMSLGCLVVAGVLDIFMISNQVSLKETALLNRQDQQRLLHFFLRRKIHMAGNAVCLAKPPDHNEAVIQTLSPQAAHDAFGVSVKSDTEVLLLRECVRINQNETYLPLLFYVSKSGDSLFYQMGTHPRAALVSGVEEFHVDLHGELSEVVIHYGLHSMDSLPFQWGVIYANAYGNPLSNQ